MICLILGDTNFPKKIIENFEKKKLKYFIIDLSKKNIFKKNINSFQPNLILSKDLVWKDVSLSSQG